MYGKCGMAQIKTTSGPQVSFDDRKKEIIRRNIVALLNEVEAGSLFVGFEVSHSQHVLGSLLKVSNIEDEHQLRHLLLRAAINIKGLADPQIPSFIEALGFAAATYLEREVKEYKLLFPLNLSPGRLPNQTSFVVGGLEFTPEGWENIRKNYDLDGFVNEIYRFIGCNRDDNLWNWGGTPLTIKLFGRNSEEVFRKAEEAYDLLRAIINFQLDTRITVQLARREPIAKIRPAVGYGVFSTDGKLDTPFINHEHQFLQELCTDEISPKWFTELLEKSNEIKSDSSSLAIFFTALKSNNNALETTVSSNAFLSFWQALEILTYGPNENYSMSDVIARIKVFIKGNEPMIDFLNICASRRNKLVHRGHFSPDGQPEVLLLKPLVRHCISRFYSIIQTYPTRSSLTEMYNHSFLQTDILTERMRVIESILTSRKTHKEPSATAT